MPPPLSYIEKSHLDLFPGDAHPLCDQLFLCAVWVAHVVIDAVQQLQLVPGVAQPLPRGWGSKGAILCNDKKNHVVIDLTGAGCSSTSPEGGGKGAVLCNDKKTMWL